ncbi:MAG TPA: recombinase RecT [Chryseolinea sp.]|nr:recombinase RecT [Chryseolinea sp.]
MDTSTQLTVKNLFGKDEVRNKFQEMLGKRAPSFITSVLQIVASNALLTKADPHSVYHSAAVAATLDLPLNNNLGFAYIVPYNQKYKDSNGNWQSKQVAQFQMGYKGFIQLAQRTGMYRTLSAAPIYEGQLISENPLTGFVFDFTKKKSDTIIGYASYFQLLNGFEKTLYATVDELKKHGKRFSQTFKKDHGLWVDDFDSMALKTVIKANLSKWAPLSVDIQKAITFDQSVIKDVETQDVDYVDNQPEQLPEVTHDELQKLLEVKLALLNKSEFDNAKRILDNKEEASYKKLFTLLTEKTDE